MKKHPIASLALVGISALILGAAPSLSHAEVTVAGIKTCSDLSTHAQYVLREGKSACPAGQAEALWVVAKGDAIASSTKTILVCSSKNPDRLYRNIKQACPPYSVATRYVHTISLPSQPEIISGEASSQSSIVIQLGAVATSGSPVAFYYVTNQKVGTTSKIFANRAGTIQIDNLKADTGYTFSISAVNFDGESKPASNAQPFFTASGNLLGMTGLGGGTIFYYSSTGFACGPTLTNTCHYQEFAPSTWASTPRYKSFHVVRSAYYSTSVLAFNGFGPTSEVMGGGYSNSLAFIHQNGDCSDIASCDYAFGAVEKYSANGYSDWYIPNTLEMQQLCKFVKGQDWVSDENVCTADGTPDPAKFLVNIGYATSNEANNSMYHYMNLGNGHAAGTGKPDSAYIIPIRSY